MSRLFVYGTLQSGQPQGALLAACSRVPASTRGQLYALPAGYPALVPGGTDQVFGQLVEPVDERLLGVLDHYEGVAEGLYRRVEVEVDVGLRRQVAWTYVMDHPESRGGLRLPDGRWRGVVRR